MLSHRRGLRVLRTVLLSLSTVLSRYSGLGFDDLHQRNGSSKGPTGRPDPSARLHRGLPPQQNRSRAGGSPPSVGITTRSPSIVPLAKRQVPAAAAHSSNPMACLEL